MPYSWYHTFMRKTTVYLTDEESEGLRRLAASAGASQAELIRQGVRQVLGRASKRTFHSLGAGSAGATPPRPRWNPDSLYDKVRGRS